MKKLVLFFMCVQTMQAIDMAISSDKNKIMPLLIGIIEKKSDGDFATVASFIKKDLMFTRQFEVTVKAFASNPSKKELAQLAQEGIPLAVFLSSTHNGFDWRVYDTSLAKMVVGKKYKKGDDEPRIWAHGIADALWPIFTGQHGFFSTRIAYTRVMNEKKRHKHVYVADYDGSHAQKLVDTPTINVAPRWNNDHKRPLIFYSDFTNTNVRMMATDLNKHRTVASNFDGVNMIPAFSRDGKKLVYCLSRGDGTCQLYYCTRDAETKKSIFKKITHNEGNNVSPSLTDDGNTVFFCSDFESKNPQLYAYDIERDILQRLTRDGYCTSPRYSAQANKVAYSKMVNGVQQIFVYDLAVQTHTQLTSDAGDKEECSWSPCGTRILYCVQEEGKTSRIAMMSVLFKDIHYLTDVAQDCTYPDWSPIYDKFPTVTKA